MSNTRLAHRPGADNQDRMPRKIVSEDLSGQFRCYTANRCGPETNSGLGANLLTHVESSLKDSVQDATRKPGLAQQHRVQTSGNTEKVTHRIQVFMRVKMRADIEGFRAK